ncbi:MAG: TIGR03790 family protein [Verrucomicrobiota bacterium]
MRTASFGAFRWPTLTRVWFRFGLLLALLTGHLLADGGEVLVLYNTEGGSESRRVAEFYARRREVPPRQVLGLPLPTTETMTRTEYRKRLAEPLLKALEARDLLQFRTQLLPGAAAPPGRVGKVPVAAKVRYLVLCYGVPLRILRDETIEEPEAQRLPEPLRRNEAAVDSELALLPDYWRSYLLAGPVRNPVYAVTNAAQIQATNGVLMVARLDGPTPAIARGLVDKALAAETNGLWGRAYFDSRGLANGNYKVGDDWIRAAFFHARHQGFETLLDTAPETFRASTPLPQIALYAGWYDQHVSGPFTRPNVEFMPGAIAYHLYSFSAQTVRSAQSWVGTFLNQGVTATMGCVDEPYLEGTPNLEVFFERLLNREFTLGEAACAAQSSLSWQTTIVGDPLYRPFGRSAQRMHEDLVKRQSPLLEWSHLRVVNLNLAAGSTPADAITYLEGLPELAHSALLNQKLGDLLVLTRQLAPAAEAYRKALALKPSPQQRIHLQLGEAMMLATLDQPAASLVYYEQFFSDNPGYPDLMRFYERALPVAQKAGSAEITAKYEREIQRLTPATEASPGGAGTNR